MSRRNMPTTCLIAVIFWLSTGSTAIPNGHGGVNSVLGVSNASVLLLDPSSETLYLGARGSILALHTSNLTWKHPAIEWEATEEKRRVCESKGKTENDCYNYICLLEVLKDGKIYVCGSYAYGPQCAFIDPVTFALVKEGGDQVKMENGKGKCPYDPRQPHTAVTADGVLYTASPSNFLGTEFDITRATGQQVRMDPSINWLSDPEFVGSALVKKSPGDDDKIYFFFTENAREYDFYTKVRVTRVARVCKGDVGGNKILQKQWTSFVKAQLVCQDRDGGQRYTVLIHAYPLEHRLGDPSSTHFYALFTSQREGGGIEREGEEGKGQRVSAVCVYSLADITKVFATGDFKNMKRNYVNSGSSESVPDPRPGQCINDDLRAKGYNTSFQIPDRVLQFIKENPLLKDTLDAVPLLVRRGITYTRITANNISNSDAALLHLGTDQGELHSVSIVGRTATLLQVIPLTTSVEPVNNILIHQGHVVVGSPSSLSRVPVEGCRVYSSCQVCVRAAGLGCVWDVNKRACVVESPGQTESKDPLVCGTGEGRCSPVVKELSVMKGLVVLLPCDHPHLSPLPCIWEHPQGRHILQHHSHLEVMVSESSLGVYSCLCPVQGNNSWGREPCLTASYQLTMEVGRSPVRVYISCVLLGALVGALGATVFLKRLCWRAAQHTPLEDRNGRGANQEQQGRGPTCYENKLMMSDMPAGLSGQVIL